MRDVTAMRALGTATGPALLRRRPVDPVPAVFLAALHAVGGRVQTHHARLGPGPIPGLACARQGVPLEIDLCHAQIQAFMPQMRLQAGLETAVNRGAPNSPDVKLTGNSEETLGLASCCPTKLGPERQWNWRLRRKGYGVAEWMTGRSEDQTQR
jgi:hypothetical protein